MPSPIFPCQVSFVLHKKLVLDCAMSYFLVLRVKLPIPYSRWGISCIYWILLLSSWGGSLYINSYYHIFGLGASAGSPQFTIGRSRTRCRSYIDIFLPKNIQRCSPPLNHGCNPAFVLSYSVSIGTKHGLSSRRRMGWRGSTPGTSF